MEKTDDHNPGLVRKDFYAFLESEGFKVTDTRHQKIRGFMRKHTEAENAQIRHKVSNLENAFHNQKLPPKVQTIIKRMDAFQCPACGKDLMRRKDDTFVTTCGHASGLSFGYA